MSSSAPAPSDPSWPIPYTLPLPGGIPDTHRPHTEAKTTILVPKDNIAFLNPVQEYNRDLSVAVIRAWNEMRKEEAEGKWRRKRENWAKGKGKGKGKKGAQAKVENSEGEATEVTEVKEKEAGAEEETANAQPVAGPSTEPKFRAPQITILEALSATGLRSIRYAKEIPDVKVVLANDLSPSACEAMRTNVALNGVAEVPRPPRANGAASKAEGVEAEAEAEEEVSNKKSKEDEAAERIGRREGARGGVRVNEGDACALMYQHRAPSARVDVVDLDPYGTAAPFIDAAIGAIADGGLLCVTCTDLAVLAGSQYPEKCFSNYGGVCVSAEYSHEVALRLVLNSLASTAARYGRYITPLLSFSIDFYVRLFVRVNTQADKVKQVASRIGTVYTCGYCQSPTIQPFGRVVDKETKGGHNRLYKSAPGPTANGSTCEECGSTMHLGGPMWIGAIQDNDFAKRVLSSIEGQQAEYKTWTRMHGMLTMASEELDSPFYFTNNKIHGFMHTSSGPTSRAVSALLNAGYSVSRSHATSGSVKTDAPRSFLFDMVREYIKTNPVRLDKIAEGSPARRMILKPMTHTVDFTAHPDAKKYEKGEKVVYYQTNPTPNWGPAQRAKVVKAPASASVPTPMPGQAKRKSEEGGEGVDGETKRAKTEVEAGEEEGMNA